MKRLGPTTSAAGPQRVNMLTHRQLIMWAKIQFPDCIPDDMWAGDTALLMDEVRGRLRHREQGPPRCAPRLQWLTKWRPYGKGYSFLERVEYLPFARFPNSVP